MDSVKKSGLYEAIEGSSYEKKTQVSKTEKREAKMLWKKAAFLAGGGLTAEAYREVIRKKSINGGLTPVNKAANKLQGIMMKRAKEMTELAAEDKRLKEEQMRHQYEQRILREERYKKIQEIPRMAIEKPEKLWTTGAKFQSQANLSVGIPQPFNWDGDQVIQRPFIEKGPDTFLCRDKIMKPPAKLMTRTPYIKTFLQKQREKGIKFLKRLHTTLHDQLIEEKIDKKQKKIAAGLSGASTPSTGSCPTPRLSGLEGLHPDLLKAPDTAQKGILRLGGSPRDDSGHRILPTDLTDVLTPRSGRADSSDEENAKRKKEEAKSIFMRWANDDGKQYVDEKHRIEQERLDAERLAEEERNRVDYLTLSDIEKEDPEADDVKRKTIHQELIMHIPEKGTDGRDLPKKNAMKVNVTSQSLCIGDANPGEYHGHWQTLIEAQIEKNWQLNREPFPRPGYNTWNTIQLANKASDKGFEFDLRCEEMSEASPLRPRSARARLQKPTEAEIRLKNETVDGYGLTEVICQTERSNSRIPNVNSLREMFGVANTVMGGADLAKKYRSKSAPAKREEDIMQTTSGGSANATSSQSSSARGRDSSSLMFENTNPSSQNRARSANTDGIIDDEGPNQDYFEGIPRAQSAHTNELHDGHHQHRHKKFIAQVENMINKVGEHQIEIKNKYPYLKHPDQWKRAFELANTRTNDGFPAVGKIKTNYHSRQIVRRTALSHYGIDIDRLKRKNNKDFDGNWKISKHRPDPKKEPKNPLKSKKQRKKFDEEGKLHINTNFFENDKVKVPRLVCLPSGTAQVLYLPPTTPSIVVENTGSGGILNGQAYWFVKRPKCLDQKFGTLGNVVTSMDHDIFQTRRLPYPAKVDVKNKVWYHHHRYKAEKKEKKETVELPILTPAQKAREKAMKEAQERIYDDDFVAQELEWNHVSLDEVKEYKEQLDSEIEESENFQNERRLSAEQKQFQKEWEEMERETEQRRLSEEKAQADRKLAMQREIDEAWEKAEQERQDKIKKLQTEKDAAFLHKDHTDAEGQLLANFVVDTLLAKMDEAMLTQTPFRDFLKSTTNAHIHPVEEKIAEMMDTYNENDIYTKVSDVHLRHDQIGIKLGVDRIVKIAEQELEAEVTRFFFLI